MGRGRGYGERASDGAVAANARLRKHLASMLKKERLQITLLMPDPKLSTDNAMMIALAAYLRIISQPKGKKLEVSPSRIRAIGHLRLK